MKFAITSKGDQKSNVLMHKMRTYLLDFDLIYDEDQPDIVVSIGGDGTLLYAFHRYSSRLDKTAFVGIHTGHLGFYADWIPDEIEKLVIAIAKTPYQVVEYPLVEVIIRYQHAGKESRYLALNESTVKSIEGTTVMDIEIRGQHFERFPVMDFVFLLHLAAPPIIRPLGEPLFTHPFQRFRWQKWHRLITRFFEQLDHRLSCQPTILACLNR